MFISKDLNNDSVIDQIRSDCNVTWMTCSSLESARGLSGALMRARACERCGEIHAPPASQVCRFIASLIRFENSRRADSHDPVPRK